MHSVFPDTMDPVHEHPHKPTIHNLSGETSFCPGANKLNQNDLSENEKVAIEEADDQFTCLKTEPWFAPKQKRRRRRLNLNVLFIKLRIAIILQVKIC